MKFFFTQPEQISLSFYYFFPLHVLLLFAKILLLPIETKMSEPLINKYDLTTDQRLPKRSKA